jgi:hypothetical protein
MRLQLLSVVGTLHPHVLDYQHFPTTLTDGGRHGRGEASVAAAEVADGGGRRLGSGLSSAVEQRLGELLVLSRRSAPDSGVTPWLRPCPLRVEATAMS